jgi:CheY-like chemotaxis protein
MLAQESRPAGSLSSFAGKTILVADDDEATRRSLTTLLASVGFTVLAAADGREALEALRHQPPPDLVLLDLVMPHLDGWQLLREKSQDPDLASIPVVVVSGVAEPDRQAGSLGVRAQLQKPVAFDQLLAVIESLVTPGKPRVLLADDDPDVLALLTAVLEHNGFEVLAAQGGPEAVELYRKHQAEIAVVLLDVQMPVLDGPATLVAIRQVNPAVPCCLMSGDAARHITGRVREAGADLVFKKPFHLTVFAQAFRQLLTPG